MKAVICTKYGSPEVLHLQEVDKPLCKVNEVCIRIVATTVHIGDSKIRRLRPDMGKFTDIFMKLMMRIVIGIKEPRKKILGMDLAGVVESVGKNVINFKVGDEIFGSSEMRFGTYAEYICLPEDAVLSLKPKNVTFNEVAPVCNGGLTALYLLRKAKIQKDKKILIYGASGSVGTFSVQLAKYFGANVTGVCSTSNINMVKSLGADRVIDYTEEDFTHNVEQYDIILDAVGKLRASKCKVSLVKNGIYLNVLKATDTLKLKSEDLDFLKELIEAGDLHAVIDKTYLLEDIVDAHRYVDSGHKKGNVVIRLKK